MVGDYAERLYAIRPYTPRVPLTVTSFVQYLREVITASDGLGDPSKLDRYGAPLQRCGVG